MHNVNVIGVSKGSSEISTMNGRPHGRLELLNSGIAFYEIIFLEDTPFLVNVVQTNHFASEYSFKLL